MSTTTPIVKYIYNRYGTASPTQDAVIEMRITYMRRQKYITTGIRVYPGEWRSERVTGRGDAAILNKTLDKLMVDVRGVIYDMMEEGNIDIFAIPVKLHAKLRLSKGFVPFCKERAEVRKYNKSSDSKERYDRFIRFLEDYGKIKSFHDLTDARVMELDRYLKARNGMKAKSRWNNYHRFLNSFILDAMKVNLVGRNPYDSLKIDHGDDSEGIYKYLTPEEFHAVRTAEMPSERLERVRDLFVFHCYTCLSYHDLRVFDAEKIQEKDGKRFYMGKRGKTNVEFTIPILKEAQAILDKYDGRLPVLSNVKYNAYLKELTAIVGIKKQVTTHWARHTGATLLLNAGVPMQTVSKICGHSSIKMTEKIYARLLPETVVDAVYEVEDKLK